MQLKVANHLTKSECHSQRQFVDMYQQQGNHLIDNAYEDARFNPSNDIKFGYKTKSVLCVAVKDGKNGDILGCVEVLNKRNNQVFSPDDLNLMEILCEHISVAVKNGEKSKVSASEIRESMGSLQALRDQIQHMSSEENALKSSIDRSKRVMEYSRKLSGVFKINDIVKQVVNQTKKLLKCDRATLFVLDEQKNMLWSKVAQGNEMIKIPKDKGLVGHAVMTKLCINIPDAYVDEGSTRH